MFCFGLFLSYKICSGYFDDDKNIELIGLNKAHSIYKKNNIKKFIREAEIFELEVNQYDQNGFSIAHLATREGKSDWLAVLNWLKADLDEPDQSLTGWPPIAWAISAGQINTVKLLLHYGVPLVFPGGPKR